MTSDPRHSPTLGNLWRWNDDSGLVAFASGDMHSRNKIICIGGLTDGLLACPYTPLITERFCSKGWGVVQPLFSSSYSGYGTGSLERDSIQISEFILHLREKWSCERVVIVGHSTGCQNAVHFAQYGNPNAVAMLVGIALQAPVSDQESAQQEPGMVEFLAWAKSQSQSTAEVDMLMPLEAHYTPITVRRFLSLFDRFGDDDFFSSYFSPQQFAERLGHLAALPHLKAVLVAYSMSDQYVPKAIDKNRLVDSLVAAIGPKAIALKLDGDHNLLSPADGSAQREFVDALENMVDTRLLT